MWLEKGAGLRSPLWRGQMIAPGRAGQQIAPGLRTQTVAPGRGGQMIAPGRRGQRWGMGNADPYLPRMVKIDGIPNPVSAPVADTSTFRRVRIGPGARGTEETMEKVAEMAAEAARDPYFIAEARGIVRGLPSKDFFGEADAVLQWVPRMVDYRGDAYETDWVSSPGWTLYVDGQEDCESLAGLICGLDLALGYGCKLRSYSLERAGEYSHCTAMIGRRVQGGQGLGGSDDVEWFSQDAVPTPARLGWEPPESQWLSPPRDYIVAMP